MYFISDNFLSKIRLTLLYQAIKTLYMALQHIGYIAEAIGTLAALLSAYLVYRKNKEYIGNKLLSLSMTLIGVYIGSILTYDLIRNELVIQIFYRIAISSLLLGIIFLYFAMQVIVHSSAWLENKKVIRSLLLFWLIYTIIIIFGDVIEIIDIDVANTQMNLPLLIIIVISVILFLFTSIFDLYLHGIKHAEKNQKLNRWIFLLGLIISLCSVFFSVLSAIVEDEFIGFILDIVTFSVLALSQAVIAYGFSRKPKGVKIQ